MAATAQRDRANRLFLEAVGATGCLTVRDVCLMARVHRATLMKHVEAGHIQADRTVLRGRRVILFDRGEAAAYARKAGSLRDNASKAMLEEVRRAGFVTAGEAACRAGVSLPTLRKHVRKGFLRGEKRTFSGRTLLVFSESAAARYAAEARSIVRDSARANNERGAVRAFPGYVTLRDLARMSRRSLFDLYDRVQAGDLAVVRIGGAMMAKQAEATRFLETFGLSSPPPGLVSIPEAARVTGLDPSTIHHAIRYGYVTALPAKDAVTSSGRRTGQPRTLVSLEDAKRYASSSRAERRGDRALRKMIDIGQRIAERVNDG